MKRKLIGTYIFTLGLLLVLLGSTKVVFADDTIKAVGGYGKSDSIYIFADVSKKVTSITRTELFVEDSSIRSVEGSPKQFYQTDGRVHYAFLVDESGSMRELRPLVEKYINALAKQEKRAAAYDIYGFGSDFDVISEGLTDAKTVKKTLKTMNYDKPKTNPYNGVTKALERLDGIDRDAGDLVNLVILSDGEPDLPDEIAGDEAELSAKAISRIQASPDAVFHSICFGGWTDTSKKMIESGTGVHGIITSESESKNAGINMAVFCDNLYRMDFQVSGVKKDGVPVRVKVTAKRSDANMTDYNSNKLGNLTFVGADAKSSKAAKAKNKSKEAPKESRTAKGKKSKKNYNVKSDGGAEENDGAAGDNAEDKVTTQKKSGPNIRRFIAPVIAGALVLVLLIVFVIVLAIKNRRKNDRIGHTELLERTAVMPGGMPDRKSTLSPESEPVFLLVEVVQGNYMSGNEFVLKRELTIGSAPTCDMVWQESLVAPVHARIILDNGQVYLEDMNSPDGVGIGGMRINGINPLRHGDVITMANCCFEIKFVE